MSGVSVSLNRYRLIRILVLVGFVLFAYPYCMRAADGPKVEEPITVDFPDESRFVILQNIADVCELNVVIPGNLPGRVSLKMRHQNWRTLYDQVLRPIGFAWREENGVVTVYDAIPEARIAVEKEPNQKNPQGTFAPVIWAPAAVSTVTLILGALLLLGRRGNNRSVGPSLAPDPASVVPVAVAHVGGDSPTLVVAAFIRVVAFTHFVQGISLLATLSTYISLYQRFSEIPATSQAGLVGIISTSFLIIFYAAIGFGLWSRAIAFAEAVGRFHR